MAIKSKRKMKWINLLLALGMVTLMLLGTYQPARADGPLIPGYTLQDGRPIPAPTGYVQEGIISGDEQPCGPLNAPLDLFRDPATGNLLVADTGNNRIVILDENGVFLMEIGGESAGLNGPEGIFVDPAGNIWVADKGNQRVAVFKPDGSLLAEHKKPETLYLEDIDFTPSKIVVDKRSFIYIVTGSKNNLGVVVLDNTERFRGFFGRTRIKFNLGRFIQRLFATETQRKRMLRVQPAPLGNLHLDAEGFIYAVSPVMTKDQIQRLNSVGTNVYGEVGTRLGAGKLWDRLRGKEGIVFGESDVRWGWNDAMRMSIPEALLPQFIDLAVDDLGIVSVIDGRNNRIYQYDPGGSLLTIFGGSGSSEGFLQTPSSIVSGTQGRLYVLDSRRNNIQIFRPTELTLTIHQASYAYFNGDYVKAAQLWADIAMHDTNFALAHSGLGKSLMSQKRYQEAMQEYYYAENKDGYSAAFGEFRQIWMRANFGWIGMGFIGVVIAAGTTWNRTTTGFRRLIAWLLTLQERAGLWAVPVLVVLTILVRMISLSATSFHFSKMRPDEIRLIFESGKVIIPWFTWCLAAFLVGEIFFGEGTFRKIVIGSAWALWPLILLPIPISLISHVISLDEKWIYNSAYYVIWILIVWEFLMVVKNIHNFEFVQSIAVIILNLVGMVALWVLVGLVYALTAEIFRFVAAIVLEVYVRLY